MNQETEFLQSDQWMAFQEATGKKSLRLSLDFFSANGLLHALPFAGQYLYVPRGPVCHNFQFSTRLPDGQVFNFQKNLEKLIEKAKKSKAIWIRMEPETEELLEGIKKATDKKIVKAPHDIQPRAVFRMDLSPSEEELFSAMKPKTRYNIRLAEKRGVRVFTTRDQKYVRVFLDLIRKTADRKAITPHPVSYYEQLLNSLPEDMCRLFVAEYEAPASTREGGSSVRGGQVLGANLLIIFGTTATYLHGGSSDVHRGMMAPYLLQWEQMKFAKQAGCVLYDFGGVSTGDTRYKISDSRKTAAEKERPFIAHHPSIATHSWAGITKFKMGFSPQTEPVVFPGAYDIILNSQAYAAYRVAEYCKKSIKRIKKYVTH